MKILVVGHGGREHALLWKLRRDAPGASFFATRPNPGMAALATPVDLAPEDLDGLATWADGEGITLTIVGPEVPLAQGIGDLFRKRGLPLFGPSAAAARIESSKAFAKQLMERAGVPSAAHRTFTKWPEAEAYLKDQGAPIVVKASGLAAGKGAVVCETEAEALSAAREMLAEAALGDAGREIVIEEFMEGEEISVFGITDGRHVSLLLPSQAHKRVGGGDKGPNTGGMGAYAPVPGVDAMMLDGVRDRIFLPVLEALEASAAPFRGLLYAGLMLTPEGPRVVEFNARFGDPETQVVLPLMDEPLLELLVAVARGGSIEGVSDPGSTGRVALNTVLTSGGYPGSYEKGQEIHIPEGLVTPRSMPGNPRPGPDRTGDPDDGLLVFHAGTRRDEAGRTVTAGGRVLSVVGFGDDVAEARERSLAAARAIDFEGKSFRPDIGWRAVGRSEGAAVRSD
ncbi:phosphoribosylamine--glycine ligase [soil metagenome]